MIKTKMDKKDCERLLFILGGIKNIDCFIRGGSTIQINEMIGKAGYRECSVIKLKKAKVDMPFTLQEYFCLFEDFYNSKNQFWFSDNELAELFVKYLILARSGQKEKDKRKATEEEEKFLKTELEKIDKLIEEKRKNEK